MKKGDFRVKTEIYEAPASTENSVLSKEIRNLKIKKVKYMRPILVRSPLP